MYWRWNAASVEHPSRIFNGWRMATTSLLAINTNNTSFQTGPASLSFKIQSPKKTLEHTLAKLSVTDAVTVSVIMFNTKARLKISLIEFIVITIAIHWSLSSRPVWLTTQYHRVEVLHFSLKLHRTAKPNGSETDGSSITSRQSASSSTTATAFSLVSSTMQLKMNQRNTCARSPIPTAHRSPLRTSISSIQIHAERVKSHQAS